MTDLERERVIGAVAARLPGAEPRARASNVLRALDEAGYVVVQAADWRGTVSRLESDLGKAADALDVSAAALEEARLPLSAQSARMSALHARGR